MNGHLTVLNKLSWKFPGSLVVKTWDFTAMGQHSIPGQETKIL